MNLRVASISTCLFLAAIPLCSGQQTPQQIDLSETVELARLVDLCASRLGLNIEYDARLTGTATLRLNTGLSDAELWSLANRLLAARGYTTVRMGDDGTLSVVSQTSAAPLAVLESAESLADPGAVGAPGFRSVIAPVVARRAQDAVAPISPLLSDNAGRIEALPDSDAVIIADLAPRLRMALGILNRMESAAVDAIPAEVSLSHQPADELIVLLKQLPATREAAGARRRPGELLAGPGDRSIVIIAAPAEIAGRREAIERFDRREVQEHGLPFATRLHRQRGCRVNREPDRR